VEKRACCGDPLAEVRPLWFRSVGLQADPLIRPDRYRNPSSKAAALSDSNANQWSDSKRPAVPLVA
jgi:hypothetical protein